MPDRDALIPMLQESAQVFVDSFADLTRPQLTFRPAPERWSISETAEHVILAEVGSSKLMRGRMIRESTPPEVLAATAGGDGRIDARLKVRAGVLPAPDFVMPKGSWPTAGEMVDAFQESRQATVEFLKTTPLDLATYAAPHPAFGPLTGLQWAYFIVRHCLRHVEQIEEVKATAGYPAA
jgi:hypothetical protein